MRYNPFNQTSCADVAVRLNVVTFKQRKKKSRPLWFGVRAPNLGTGCVASCSRRRSTMIAGRVFSFFGRLFMRAIAALGAVVLSGVLADSCLGQAERTAAPPTYTPLSTTGSDGTQVTLPPIQVGPIPDALR